MRKYFVICFSLILFFSFQLGSVYAKTPLNETVDKLLDIKYQWGGDTVKGFDCSGFTMYVFNQFGIDLPHYSKGQSTKGTTVSKDNLRAGDLVFFNTSGKGISHVGIYLGDNQFIHASSNKGVIKSNMSEKYYADRYVTATRILQDDAFKRLTTEPVVKQVIQEKRVSIVE